MIPSGGYLSPVVGEQFACCLPQENPFFCDRRFAALRPGFASSCAFPRTSLGHGSPLGGPALSSLRRLSQTVSYLLDFLRRAFRPRIGPRFAALRCAPPFS